MDRDLYHPEPLFLDGALNLLVATAPFLDGSSSASLYTESLVKREETHTAYIDNLLNAHPPTMSTLLGLFPVEYWTNASTSSTMDDLITDPSIIATDNNTRRGQMHVRLTWKRIIPECASQSPAKVTQHLHVDEVGCGRILHDVYLGIFQHEDVQRLLSDINLHSMSKASLLRYHRGSYALFLRFVRSKIAINWTQVMDHLLRLIETESSLLMGMNYIQELYLYLHIFQVHSVDAFSRPLNQHYTTAENGLESWKRISPVICITLKVPRKQLRATTNLEPTEIGTP
ncbi:uncharacterized protein Z518_09638 [Rhinocladiella mackenziei CBS 650.93]|uniref:Uncharacterized protein n=1 Tax=Rhinocladiella mackenziei CBS 650.93 TaxID=1442369 RepID=A0A0D2GQK9_9EURO|nr:uncharacterized protein Z518_09638 [Rhinocladiella mackenziei CBS 650.93]KIX00573.1 hypothetical protein Z518_09638 [Rhinocladiella mackenziei CBS 650.93]